MIRLRQYPRRVFFRRASVSSKSPLKCKVIAHRGASGRLPDHTLAGYEAAFNTGCDFIEIDAHATADGELVANHDIELSETTDVSEWAWARDRNTRVVAKCYDGEEDQMEGWMIPDFTLEELKRLRVKMRSSGRDQQYNLKFSIPTVAETCELVQKLVDDIKRTSDAKAFYDSPAVRRRKFRVEWRRVTKKRGFSGFLAPATCDDARALNLGDSWYYSWLNAPYVSAHRGARARSRARAYLCLHTHILPSLSGSYGSHNLCKKQIGKA